MPAFVHDLDEIMPLAPAPTDGDRAIVDLLMANPDVRTGVLDGIERMDEITRQHDSRREFGVLIAMPQPGEREPVALAG